jgi:hypothetical protein
VPGVLSVMQQLRVDASPIIANAQTKHLIVVSNLCLNPTGACVSECISDQLASDSTDFVVQHWREDVSLPLHGHPKSREISACFWVAKFLREHRESLSEIRVDRGRRA